MTSDAIAERCGLRRSGSALPRCWAAALAAAVWCGCQVQKPPQAGEHDAQRKPQSESVAINWFQDECVAKPTPAWPILATGTGFVVPPVRTGPQTVLGVGDYVEDGVVLIGARGTQVVIQRAGQWFVTEGSLPLSGIDRAWAAEGYACEDVAAHLDGLIQLLQARLGLDSVSGCQELDWDGMWMDQPCTRVRSVTAGERVKLRLPETSKWYLSIAMSTGSLYRHVVRRPRSPTLGCSALTIEGPKLLTSVIPIGPEAAQGTIEVNAERCLATAIFSSTVPLNDAVLQGQLRGFSVTNQPAVSATHPRTPE